MTYKEKFEELRNVFIEETDKYLKAEKELSKVNGFFDITLLSNFENSKKLFEIAGNNYYNFLVFVRDNNAKSKDSYTK